MNKGTIFELDKFAGDFVDIKDNGVLFALWEVVCIDDKFGVRITEIIGAPDAYGQCRATAAIAGTVRTAETDNYRGRVQRSSRWINKIY